MIYVAHGQLYSEREFVEHGNSNFVVAVCFLLLLFKTLLSSVDGRLLFLWTRNKEVPVNLFVSSRLDDRDDVVLVLTAPNNCDRGCYFLPLPLFRYVELSTVKSTVGCLVVTTAAAVVVLVLLLFLSLSSSFFYFFFSCYGC